MPKGKFEDIKALDQLLAAVYNAETIENVNAAAGENLQPYQPHTDEELKALYDDFQKNEIAKLAARVSRKHAVYTKHNVDYAEAAGDLKKDEELGRIWSYALDSTIGKTDEEKEQIRQKNIKILDDLKKPENKIKFLQSMKDKMLNTDYSLLFTGKEEDMLKFADQNAALCEMCFTHKDFEEILDKNGIGFTDDEKAAYDKNAMAIESVISALNLADYMASDIYPLLKDRGYDKVPGTLQDQVLGINAPVELQMEVEDYKQKDPACKNAVQTFTAMKVYAGDVSTYYQDVKLREKEQALVIPQLRNLCRKVCRFDESFLIDDNGQVTDPIDLAIVNGSILTYGSIPVDSFKSKEILVDELVKGTYRFSISRPVTPEGEHLKPLDLKMTGDKLELYSASADSVKERLMQLRTELDAAGSSIGSSPEYSKMRDALHAITDPDEMAEIKTVEDMQEAMETLVAAADNYYFAKLDQEKNTNREKRFNIAREIMQMSTDLDKNQVHKAPDRLSLDQQKEILKTDLIRKFQKRYLMNKYASDDGLTKDEKKARLAEISSPRNRAKFYTACSHTLDAVNHPERPNAIRNKGALQNITRLCADKSIEQMKNLLNMPVADFLVEAAKPVFQNVKKAPEPVKNNNNPVLGG